MRFLILLSFLGSYAFAVEYGNATYSSARSKRQFVIDLGSEENPSPIGQLFGFGRGQQRPQQQQPQQQQDATGKAAAPQGILGNLVGAFLGGLAGGNQAGQALQPNQGGGINIDFGGLANQFLQPGAGQFGQRPGGGQPGGGQFVQPGAGQFGGRPGGGQPGRPGQPTDAFHFHGGGHQHRPGRPNFVPVTRPPREFCHINPNAPRCIATPPPPPPPGKVEQIPDYIMQSELGDFITDSKFVVPGSYVNSVQDREYYLGFDQPNYPYQRCFTPGGFRGRCRYVQYCAVEQIRQDFDTFMQYACPIGNDYLGVCCPDNVSAAFVNGVAQTTTTTTTTTQRPTTTTTRPGQTTRPAQSRGCGVNAIQDTRIVGGKPADPKEYPWMAALMDGTDQYCGGVLITDKHVLTASHCVNKRTASQIRVRLGEYDFSNSNPSSRDFNVERIIMHEQYNTVSQANDIALLKLATSTTFNDDIWPICLPSATLDPTDKVATVIGWGTTSYAGASSNVLQEVDVPVWRTSDCKARYTQPITDLHVCAGYKSGGKDSCQGDSGGPLMLRMQSGRWSVIGVVSWGIRCAEVNSPGVYTRVTSYLDWIKEKATQ